MTEELYRQAPARPPARARQAMVCASEPLAVRAGLRALERGGNAADAAIAAAAVLCVTEPFSTSVGGDAFAVVWGGGEVEGLDAAGPAPKRADPERDVAVTGPESVTVPGAVAGWAALSERFGRLGLDAVLADAIGVADRGFSVSPRAARIWRNAGELCPSELRPAPAAGAVVRQPAQAASLRLIAEQGTDVLYRGPLGEAIVAASWLEPDDLAAYEPRWVQPLRHGYRGVEVVELPPPTQGVAALEGLALLEGVEPTHGNRVKCARLAVEDALANVRDGVDVEGLLDPDYLERRRRDGPVPVTEPGGGTVYLCAVDADRMAVSFIQSLFASFGSGVVAPGTGIVLQNRGACFAIEGGVRPGARPFHTLIPGLLLRGGKLLGPFGVMGGFIQAQAHLQFVSNLVDGGLDPQAALDRPRFRVDGGLLRLESGLDPAQFQSLGMEVVHEPDPFEFGGGQAVLIDGESLLGGSDSRKDGYAGAL